MDGRCRMVSEETALQIAVTSVPLSALVATYAVDSIQADDPAWYRILVLGLGLATIGAVAPGIFLGLAGATIDIKTSEMLVSLGEGAALLFVLTLVVMFKESLRGLDEEKGWDHILILGAGGLLMLLILEYVLPEVESLLGL